MIAGSGESQEGNASYAERTVRYRDISPEGIAEKVRYVAGEMERRMGEFGFGWKDTTEVQTYTIHDFHPVFAERWFAAAPRVGPDLALCPAAGDRSRIRDGLPEGAAGNGDLVKILILRSASSRVSKDEGQDAPAGPSWFETALCASSP